MIDIGSILTIITILFTGMSSVVAVAVLFGKISATVSNLVLSMDKLTAAIDRLEDKVDGHGERLASLEAREDANRVSSLHNNP